MYIKIGNYTYSCYEKVSVGDIVLLPPTHWSESSWSTVDEVDVGYPKGYDGPINEVLKVVDPSDLLRLMSTDAKINLIRKTADTLGYKLIKKPKVKVAN